MTISDNLDKPCIQAEHTKSLSKLYEETPKYKDADSSYERRTSFNAKLRIYIGDVTEMGTDAVVCSTQTDLRLPPVGLAKAVLGKGGLMLEEACLAIDEIEAGKAVITDGFNLPCKYVIHTAGPPPDTLLNYEQRVGCLRSSYLSCLNIAGNSTHIRSVAFPCLGAGFANIELSDALTVAATSIREWLEIPGHLNSLDAIVLCIYNEEQWMEYLPILVRTFPYGKDKAGFDLEQLPRVDSSTIPPSEDSTTSGILCYQYDAQALRAIKLHFHSIVNVCHKETRSTALAVDRYHNCAIIPVGSGFYKLTLFHSEDRHTLEIQVACKGGNAQYFDISLCQQIRKIISDYMESYLENITPFTMFIRCHHSSWEEENGLWEISRLKRSISMNKEVPCNHSAGHLSHQIRPVELLKYWFPKDAHMVSPARLPTENVEPSSITAGSQPEYTNRKPVQNSWAPTTHLERSFLFKFGSGAACSCSEPNVKSKEDNFRAEKSTSLYSKLKDLFTSNKNLLFSSSDSLNVQEPTLNQENSKVRTIEPLQPPKKAKECAVSSIYENRLPETYNAETERKFVQEPSKTCPKVYHSWMEKTYNVNEGERSCANRLNPVCQSFTRTSLPQNDTAGGGCQGKCMPTDHRAGKSIQAPGTGRLGEGGRCDRLTDKQIMKIARNIGNQQFQLGIQLDLTHEEIKILQLQYRDDVVLLGYEILMKWKIRQGLHATFEKLKEAMSHCDIDILSVESKVFG